MRAGPAALVGLVGLVAFSGCTVGSSSLGSRGVRPDGGLGDANGGGGIDGTIVVADSGATDGTLNSDGRPGSGDGSPGPMDDGSPGSSDAGPGGSDGAPGGSDSGGTLPPTDAAPPPSLGYLGDNELVPVTYDGTNSVAYAELPGQTTNFLGRYLLGQTGSSWGVANYTMNWTSTPEHLTFTGYALQPPVGVAGGSTVTTAYDPTVASFGGEVWVAFECGGNGITGASSCVGPYANGAIDAARTSVAVQGTTSSGCYSASVPKLLAFQGNLYMYWTAVQQDCSNGNFVALTSRGAQLQESSGLMWVAGTTSSVSTLDASHTLEVWGVGATPTTNQTADMQGTFTDGQHVFATAGLGGNAGGGSCLNPLGGNQGCYRLGVSRALCPLCPDMFSNGDQLGDANLISNPQSYTRAITTPQGALNLLTTLYGATPSTPNPIVGPTNGTPGTYRYPVSNFASYFQPEASPSGALFFGSASGTTLAAPVVGMAATPDSGGYWLAGSDGGVFSFGDAPFQGSAAGHTTAPVVGIAAAGAGGYWLVSSDGNVYPFGTANTTFGNLLGHALNKPIVGMASTAGGQGYWLVAADGGIFAYGNAPFYGSTGSITLAQPIVGIGAEPNGQGYWLVAKDGGIFSFPTSATSATPLPFYGSVPGANVSVTNIVGMGVAPSGQGYWVVGSDGGVYTFPSTLPFYGSMGGQGLGTGTAGMAVSSNGYWLVGQSGSIYNF